MGGVKASSGLAAVKSKPGIPDPARTPEGMRVETPGEKNKIIIIDDDPRMRKTLSDILKAKGYETLVAENGTEGLALLSRDSISLALIDLMLPDIPGLEVLNRIKAVSPATEAIILTGNATLDSAIEATNKGAFSYLRKPYDVEQLLLHIRRAGEKQRAEERILRQNIELQRVNAELKALYEQAKSVSLHDSLTGLPNRRFLQIQMEKSCDATKRYGEQLSVIMLDIDHFKKYNDAHGHPEGDRLLAKLAKILSKEVRRADYVFRYGGEEFLIMLPRTAPAAACATAERLRRVVASGAGITISCGVASFEDGIERPEELIEKADAALYRAKEKGRNRVEGSDVR